MGMVMLPTVATFADVLPVMEPKKELPMMATFAGPPVMRPVRDVAMSLMSREPPVRISMEPNMMKRAMSVAETPRGRPKMPPRER